jgi:hypothetical protein
MARSRTTEQKTQETVAKKSPWEACYEVISHTTKETSYDALVEEAAEVLKKSGETEKAKDTDALWSIIDKIMDNLSGLNLVELEWDVRVKPLGKLGNGVNGKTNGKR